MGRGPIFLFDLILFVPSTIFQLYRGRSSWIEPVLSYDKYVLLKDHNAVMPVKLEASAHMSRVKHSTTEPLCYQRGSDVFLGKLYNFPRFRRGFNILWGGEGGPTNSGGGMHRNLSKLGFSMQGAKNLYPPLDPRMFGLHLQVAWSQ